MLRCPRLVGESARLMKLLDLLQLIPGFGLVKTLASFVLGPLRALWRWLWRDWRHPPLLALALSTAAYMFVINPRLTADLEKGRSALAAEIEAHNGTIADFWLASRQAETRQIENKARVATQQAAITERIEHDYQTRLSALRARHHELARAVASNASGRLRAGATKVDPGAPRAAGLPGTGTAASSADEAPGDHGLSLGQRLIASEQALQLDALIDWTLAQAAVNTSPAEAAP